MDYLKYVMLFGLVSLWAAAVSCAALWAMAPLLLARARPGAGEEAPPEDGPPAEKPGIIFEFTAAQAPALARLLEKESSEDIAVVTARLPADSGRALLAALAPELRAKVLLSLASPRTVDLELMRSMKSELENRLYGAVGGAAETAPFLKAMTYKERKNMLEKVCQQEPARGAELRALFILDEDICAMPESDFKALAGAVSPKTMGAFLPALPGKLKEKIAEQYTGKNAEALEKAAPPEGLGQKEKEAALGAFMEVVEKLAAKGIIAKPPQKSRAPTAAAVKNSWG